MNYVLLDTNILIDMVVDRRNQIDNKLLNKFLKLLEFDEIKLIVPEIVKTETYRHLDKEIDNVGIQIQKVLDDIGKLYGVSTLEIEGLDLSVYKKNARKELNAALTLFESKREAYKDDIFKSIDLIFNHKNCIQIEDISLMDMVLKRKIYKKAPFHRVEKESNGDGVITESLININQFITVNEKDIIYFGTDNHFLYRLIDPRKGEHGQPCITIPFKQTFRILLTHQAMLEGCDIVLFDSHPTNANDSSTPVYSLRVPAQEPPGIKILEIDVDANGVISAAIYTDKEYAQKHRLDIERDTIRLKQLQQEN